MRLFGGYAPQTTIYQGLIDRAALIWQQYRQFSEVMNKPQTSIYQEITGRIITALEDGVNPWAKPWQAANSGPFRNALTNRPYRGMNVLLLNLMALSRGHVDPRWLTYRNAEQLGGHVRKGEKGAAIIFWKFLPARDHDVEAEADTEAFTDHDQQSKLIPLARVYTVFNAEQCEGLALPPLFEDEMPEINEANEAAETGPAICRGRIWCSCRSAPVSSMVTSTTPPVSTRSATGQAIQSG